MIKSELTLLLTIVLSVSLLMSSCTCQMVGDRVETNCYGDVVPCANNTYSLGSPTNWWQNLYVGNLVGWNITSSIGPVGNITGVGVAGTIPEWTSASALGNSPITHLLGLINFNTHTLTNVVDPLNPQDAATKNYVDSTAAGTGNVTSPPSIVGRMPYYVVPQGINESVVFWDNGTNRMGVVQDVPLYTLDVGGPIHSTGDVMSDQDINAGNDLNAGNNLDVFDDADIGGILYLNGDAIIETDKTSARDLIITTGANQTMVLTTPVWDDLQISMANAKNPASSSPTWFPYQSSEVPAFSKTATNVLYFSAQMSHTYKEGSDIQFHIHIAYPDNGAGSSVWYFTYSWANIDGTFPAASNSGNVVVVSPAVANYHDDPEIIATISGVGKTISSVLVCSISRLGGDGSDGYDNVIYLVSGDFHFQKNTIGSRTQLVK